MLANEDILTGHRKGIILGHLNVRSLWNKLDLLRATFINCPFSLIGISETWLSSSFDSSILNIKGYELFRLDRQVLNENNMTKKGGGVCLYIKDNINTRFFNLDHICISTQHGECQWVELCFENQRNIIIGNVYRPPQGHIDVFINYLDTCIEEINTRDCDTYILGDCNIDVLDKKNDSTKKLLELLTQTGFSNLINMPTRYDSNKNSCIDHIYTNSAKVFDSGVLDVNISDHEMIYVIHKKQKHHNISVGLMVDLIEIMIGLFSKIPCHYNTGMYFSIILIPTFSGIPFTLILPTV